MLEAVQSIASSSEPEAKGNERKFLITWYHLNDNKHFTCKYIAVRVQRQETAMNAPCCWRQEQGRAVAFTLGLWLPGGNMSLGGAVQSWWELSASPTKRKSRSNLPRIHHSIIFPIGAGIESGFAILWAYNTDFFYKILGPKNAIFNLASNVCTEIKFWTFLI